MWEQSVGSQKDMYVCVGYAHSMGRGLDAWYRPAVLALIVVLQVYSSVHFLTSLPEKFGKHTILYTVNHRKVHWCLHCRSVAYLSEGRGSNGDHAAHDSILRVVYLYLLY